MSKMGKKEDIIEETDFMCQASTEKSPSQGPETPFLWQCCVSNHWISAGFNLKYKKPQCAHRKSEKPYNYSWQVKVTLCSLVDRLCWSLGCCSGFVHWWVNTTSVISVSLLLFRYLWVLLTALQDHSCFVLLSDKAIVSRRWETAFFSIRASGNGCCGSVRAAETFSHQPSSQTARWWRER